MDELMQRYSLEEQEIIKKYFEELAKRTRKSGKISDNVKKKQLIKWQKYDKEVVILALQVFMERYTEASMNENYVLGIIRNQAKNKRGDSYGAGGKCTCGKNGEDEGARLAEKYTGGQTCTECDF